jgi:hypothetical protein
VTADAASPDGGKSAAQAARPSSTTAAPTTGPTPATSPPTPDHPRTVQVRQDLLHACLIQFFTERIFGPERHALLAAALPGNTTAAARQHDAETEKLRQRIRHIDTAEDAHTREIEHLTALPADSPAITALRTRIYARFTELEHERAQLTTRLHALTAQAPTAPADC